MPNKIMEGPGRRASNPREDVRTAWESLLGLAAAVTTPAELRIARTADQRADLILDRARTIAMMTGSVPWIRNSAAHGRVKTLLDRLTQINQGARAMRFQAYNSAHEDQKLPISQEDLRAIPESEDACRSLLREAAEFQGLRKANAPWSALLEYAAGNADTRRISYQQTQAMVRRRNTVRLRQKITTAGASLLVATLAVPVALNATIVASVLWHAAHTSGGVRVAAKVVPLVVKNAARLTKLETLMPLRVLNSVFGSVVSEVTRHWFSLTALTLLPAIWQTPGGAGFSEIPRLAEHNPLSRLLRKESNEGALSSAAHTMMTNLSIADSYLIGHLSVPEIEAFAVGSDAERARIFRENPPSMGAELVAIRVRMNRHATDPTDALLPPSARPAPVSRWQRVVDILGGSVDAVKLVFPSYGVFTPNHCDPRLAKRIAHFNRVLPAPTTLMKASSPSAVAIQRQTAISALEKMPESLPDRLADLVAAEQREDQMFARQAQRAMTDGFKADRHRPLEALLAKMPQSVPPEPSLGRMLRAP